MVKTHYCHIYLQNLADLNKIMGLSFVDIGILQQNTKKSLHTTRNKYLSHDWMPEEKARRFSVERFYVDLKWSKIEAGVFGNIGKDIRGILDILREAGKTGLRILVEGNCF